MMELQTGPVCQPLVAPTAVPAGDAPTQSAALAADINANNPLGCSALYLPGASSVLLECPGPAPIVCIDDGFGVQKTDGWSPLHDGTTAWFIEGDPASSNLPALSIWGGLALSTMLLGMFVWSIRRMRDRSLSQHTTRGSPSTDVKIGLGGLRDVEFMVQGLQLLSARRLPEVLSGNTLQALERLQRNKILDPRTTYDLRDDYVFLRRLEHYLQILHDRQTHVLPKAREELEALAKRMLGPRATAANLVRELERRNSRVRENYLSFIGDRHFGA